jgi:hypothetical protein
MIALYGTLIIFTINVNKENCSTQFAAFIRVSLIFIWAFKNQTPIDSTARNIIPDNII